MVVEKKTHIKLEEVLEKLKNMSEEKGVLVGIPQAKTSRPNEPINNASLLYIHTHGIRRRSMINEMDAEMAKGKAYSAAYELYIMAHGSPLWHAPPRPVLEPAIEYYKTQIADQYAKALVAAVSGDVAKTQKALVRTGELAVGYCRGWFLNPANEWPPNAPYTIEKKGSDKPLIDTGALRKAITFVVR